MSMAGKTKAWLRANKQKKKRLKQKGKMAAKKHVYCSEYCIIKSCTLFNINKKQKKNKKAIVK